MLILPKKSTLRMSIRVEGPDDGPPLLFINSLGTELSLWDRVLPHLPKGLRVIRYDMRGHGQSDKPDGPYPMGELVADAAEVLQSVKAKDAVVVGLSIGGLVAQGLAAERLDLVRGLVISNSAAKIGTAQMWEDRVASVLKDGLEPLVEPTMDRWFSKKVHRDQPDLVDEFRAMMRRQDPVGYAGCAAAIGDTDLFASTARLKLPTLGIAGTDDGSTPPDMVREVTDLVAGSRFELIRGAGHLPCACHPETYGAILSGFLKDIGHI